jgi:hypothetical protein
MGDSGSNSSAELGVRFTRFERTWRRRNRVWKNLVTIGPSGAEPGVSLLGAICHKRKEISHLYPYFIAAERPHEAQFFEKFGL